MTELIARIAGPYLIVSAIGFLVSRRFYERMVLGTAHADPLLVNLTGVVHFVIGMVILVTHWDWSGWAIAVSLLGVAAVAKGAALIVVPELTLKTPKTVGATLRASAVGFAIWGGILVWVGWG